MSHAVFPEPQQNRGDGDQWQKEKLVLKWKPERNRSNGPVMKCERKQLSTSMRQGQRERESVKAGAGSRPRHRG